MAFSASPAGNRSANPSSTTRLVNGAGRARAAATFLRRALKHPPSSIRVSPLLTELATVEAAVALQRLDSSRDGLVEDEVLAYMVLTQLVKAWLLRRRWI